MHRSLLLLALSGCLAPKYVQPPLPVTEHYPEWPDAQIAEGVDPLELSWREAFPDPALQQAISLALDNAKDLELAALRIEEARAMFRIQRSELLPGVQADAGFSESHTPASVSPFGQAFTIRQYRVGVSVPAFELDLFGRIRNLSKAARARYLATEEAYLSVRIGLIGGVATAWLAERASTEQLRLAREVLDAREQAHQLAQQRFEAGITSELEFRQSETLVESSRVTIAALTRQRAQAYNALVLLVGAPLNDLPAAEELPDHAVVQDIAPGLPSELLTQRPDIRAAEQRLRAANADIGAARAAFFPRISLTGAVGTASNDLANLFSAGSGLWSFAPQLTQPIFHWGRNRANLKVSEVRQDQAVVEYERAIQVAFREVADALAGRATLDDQVQAQERLTEAQSRRLLLAEQRYEAGVASFLEVLDAQRALAEAQQGLVSARQLRLTNAVDLYRALGGGLAGDDT